MRIATIRINDQKFLIEVLDGPRRKEDEYRELEYQNLHPAPPEPERPDSLSTFGTYRRNTDQNDAYGRWLQEENARWLETHERWVVAKAEWEKEKNLWEEAQEVVGDFQRVSELVVACSNSLVSAIEQVQDPSKITVQFGVNLSSESCTPLLARVAGDAAFKVTIEWENSALGELTEPQS